MTDEIADLFAALQRVPAGEIRVGDRMGEGRWQGVQVIDVDRFPSSEGDVHLSLGSHGWITYRREARVLIERRS